MKFKNLSVKQLFSWIMVGQAVSIIVITLTIFIFTKQTSVLLAGILLLLCTFIWFVVYAQILAKRLVSFTSDLCRTIDSMISGNEEPMLLEEQETQFARISHRLSRLYQIMQENRRRVDEERRELQTLVSDISHQVKTPVSNLKMATDTLLEKPMAEAERTDFIRGIRSQTDKLDFLFQALVKTSRLETGVIQLDKETGRLFDTVAQAMSGIVYAAEKKEISVTVDCPEDLTVSHDSKWTSEALFNLLDNAVKYTSAGGKIAVSVVLWEKPMAEAERTDFIRGIRSQTDKLDFLFQALVKTSRLETGVIQLDKKPGRLFDTVAQAMSGIVYAAEKKEIVVSVDCPEDLTVFHDSKWTSEALFNLLDNAVKYTPAGGKIAVSVVLWEMYVEIKVADTGKGISESNQAAIFRRFYREEEVHEQQGVGIGLYLAREIVTRQGGYIKVVSEPGKGSEFSIMLPTK